MSRQTKPDGPVPDRVRFEYIKSNHFRVVHVDGVIGGPAPRGNLFVNFFSERLPIPTGQVFHVSPTGALGDEVTSERQARAAIVREVETAIVMDLTTAKIFLQWLGQRIAEVEKLEHDRRAENPKGKEAD